jgi:hypothetical protein
VVAAIAIADASNPSANLFIATSRNHAASLLRGVFIIDAIMPQPTPSGKPQPTLRQRASRSLFRPAE